LLGLHFLSICCCSLSNEELNITTATYEKNKEENKKINPNNPYFFVTETSNQKGTKSAAETQPAF